MRRLLVGTFAAVVLASCGVAEGGVGASAPVLEAYRSGGPYTALVSYTPLSTDAGLATDWRIEFKDHLHWTTTVTRSGGDGSQVGYQLERSGRSIIETLPNTIDVGALLTEDQMRDIQDHFTWEQQRAALDKLVTDGLVIPRARTTVLVSDLDPSDATQPLPVFAGFGRKDLSFDGQANPSVRVERGRTSIVYEGLTLVVDSRGRPVEAIVYDQSGRKVGRYTVSSFTRA